MVFSSTTLTLAIPDVLCVMCACPCVRVCPLVVYVCPPCVCVLCVCVCVSSVRSGYRLQPGQGRDSTKVLYYIEKDLGQVPSDKMAALQCKPVGGTIKQSVCVCVCYTCVIVLYVLCLLVRA